MSDDFHDDFHQEWRYGDGPVLHYQRQAGCLRAWVQYRGETRQLSRHQVEQLRAANPGSWPEGRWVVLEVAGFPPE